jgi:phosphate acetyltransferase
MAKCLLLVPIGSGVGLPTVRIGLEHSIALQGVSVHSLCPFDQVPGSIFPQPFDPETIAKAMEQNNIEPLINKILTVMEQYAEHIIVIQGLLNKEQDQVFQHDINIKLAQATHADIIFVSTPKQWNAKQLANTIDIYVNQYRQAKCNKILGHICNKINAPHDYGGYLGLRSAISKNVISPSKKFSAPSKIPQLASIPWSAQLLSPRVSDIADRLDVEVIAAGNMEQRRIERFILCARNVENITEALTGNTLIITAADRIDIIFACCMAVLNGSQIAGLLLTGNRKLKSKIKKLCQSAIDQGLPILSSKTDSLSTCLHLQNISLEIPQDDMQKIQHIQEYFIRHLHKPWLKNWLTTKQEKQLNQAVFRFKISRMAQKVKQTIVCPEGEEIRIIQAAIICAEQNIAKIILLGNPERIKHYAQTNNLCIPEDITLMDPLKIGPKYTKDLLKIRQHKGMTPIMAEELIRNPIIVANLMLYRGEADGLVAGVEHPTAEILRPALKLIGADPKHGLVSSLFFMCFPEKILIFADCAVNPQPDSNTLAKIAMQTAESAQSFSIDPKVAMISYSTGKSASGKEIQRVSEATELVQAQQPSLAIDGPLQYDTAISPEVAALKAANSAVAGKANVFIFPDLNTGNTTYKAVQRTSNILCIGPILQGLNYPVNDLSRGATVEDIVYTLTITAIQAARNKA